MVFKKNWVHQLLIFMQIVIMPIQAENNEEIFAEKFGSDNEKPEGESYSGSGSNYIQTEVIRKKIPELLEQLDCKILIDAPCGDFFWMKEVHLEAHYIGCDVISGIINKLQEKYGNANRCFLRVDFSVEPIPYGDVILCRDCLVHHTYENIANILKTFKASGSQYLLMTTFPTRSNANIRTGEWRPLNFTAPPFNFPMPIVLINEGCTEGNGYWHDKSLGLWRLSDLPDFF